MLGRTCPGCLLHLPHSSLAPTLCATTPPLGLTCTTGPMESLGWATWKPSLPTLRVLPPDGSGLGLGMASPSLAHLTLLMALSARLAALYLSGWPWVLRHSVYRKDTRCVCQVPLAGLRGLHGVGLTYQHQTPVGAAGRPRAGVQRSCQALLRCTAPKGLCQIRFGWKPAAGAPQDTTFLVCLSWSGGEATHSTYFYTSQRALQGPMSYLLGQLIL